ncbi:MAG: hypothetical protein ABI042_07250 [Verrucomicrobiota bacterium]
MIPIFANVGVPMFFPQIVLMAFAFIPVVFIEALFVRKFIRVTFPDALAGTAIANAWTTLLGVPIAWLLMFIFELVNPIGGKALGVDSPIRMLIAVTLQAAWLIPYEEDLRWMIPAAATFLLLPCFAISVFIERWILVRRWPDKNRKVLFSTVLRANLWSYLSLFVGGCVWTSKNFK